MGHFSQIDELVQSATLYHDIPVLLQGCVMPFLSLYVIWVYGWLVVYGFEDYTEAGFLGIAAIAVCHILCCLACYWSVHVYCFLTCRKVSRLESKLYARELVGVNISAH